MSLKGVEKIMPGGNLSDQQAENPLDPSQSVAHPAQQDEFPAAGESEDQETPAEKPQFLESEGHFVPEGPELAGDEQQAPPDSETEGHGSSLADAAAEGESESTGSWNYDEYVQYAHYEQYQRLTAPLTAPSQPLDTLEGQEQLASTLQKNQASTIWLLAAFLIISLVLCGIFMLLTSSNMGY